MVGVGSSASSKFIPVPIRHVSFFGGCNLNKDVNGTDEGTSETVVTIKRALAREPYQVPIRSQAQQDVDLSKNYPYRSP